MVVLRNSRPRSSPMSTRIVISSFEYELYRYKRYSELAIDQFNDIDLHTRINPRQNSLAVIMQHMNGTMLARFTNLLAGDGEQPTSDREAEFADRGLARDPLTQIWEAG